MITFFFLSIPGLELKEVSKKKKKKKARTKKPNQTNNKKPPQHPHPPSKTATMKNVLRNSSEAFISRGRCGGQRHLEIRKESDK